MKSNLKTNFIYNSAYQMLSMIVPLVTTPYISRVLGADGVGIYSYNYSIAAYFVMFILLGLNNYGNREIAIERSCKEKVSR
ncbi:oligosaccharide flippase family protein, partial [Enterococcus hirae]|nr:oligosaccharide flippase family protein [Enterococcus hirae]